MPVLEKIRSKAGIFIAVFIGFALFAFILGDFLNSGKSLFRQSEMEIGIIQGKKISLQEFEEKLNENSELYKLKYGQSNISENATESLKEQTWNEFLIENILNPEYGKLGLGVGKDELADLITGNNPSPVIRQNFGDPNTGEINRAMVSKIWSSYEQNETTKAIVLSVEKDVNTERAFTKYTNIIRKGLYVPKFLAKSDYVETNEKVDLGFIVKRYTDIPDSSVKITSSDLKKYYGDHKYLFEQTPSRDIEYVTFDIVPSKEDFTAASDYIAKLKDEFAAAEDVKQYVNSNSDIQFDSKFYKQSQLSDTLAHTLFSASEGAVFGPYFENETYKIARLVKSANIPDSVKAQHILIVPTEKTQAGLEKAKNLADSIKGAIEKGANFAALANKYSADKASLQKGGDLGWFTEAKMVPAFSEPAFAMKKGEVRVVQSEFGIHVIQLTDRGVETKKVQIAYLARKVDASTQTNHLIFAKASKFASDNRTYEKFNSAINSSNGKLVKKLASSITLNDKTIAGLQSPRELIRWAYKSKKGEISEVINLQNAFVVAAVSQIREDKFAPLDQVKTEVELAVRKEKKGEQLVELINKEKSGVKTLQDLAAKMNLNVESASGVSFSSFSIGSAGIEPKLIATAMLTKPNEISVPVKGNNGVYVAFVTSKTAAEGKDFTQSQQKLNYQFQSRANYENFDALKKLANIEDRRGKFY